MLLRAGKRPRSSRQLRAGSERGHPAERPNYSMTSSARASSVGGTSSPSAFAVFRFITSSYLVGACTGRSRSRQ
jgi:hypothetical protein